MDTNFFAPRYLKLFSVNNVGKDGEAELELKVNAWVKETNALILEAKVDVKGGIFAAITYTQVENEEHKAVAVGEAKAPVTGKAPVMDMIKKEGDTRTKVRLMAGAFPAEEGGKMHPDDQEPAPPPLLAESCNLKKYGNLFGNIGGSHAGSTNSTSPSTSPSCGASNPKQ